MVLFLLVILIFSLVVFDIPGKLKGRQWYKETEPRTTPISKGNLSLSVVVSPKVLTSSKNFNITVTLKNTGSNEVRVIPPIRWVSLRIEIYFENGTQIKYTGPRPSILSPTDENLKVLHPGDEILRNYRFSWGVNPKQDGVRDWYFPWEGRYKVVVVYDPNLEYSKITLPYWKEKMLKGEDWFEIKK